MARKPQVKIFAVRGTGEFPVEAMHYDDAQALTPADQAVVLATYNDEDDSVLWDGKKLRMNTVRLITAQQRAPTHRKWDSHTWVVCEEAREPTAAEHAFLRDRFGHDWLTRDYPLSEPLKVGMTVEWNYRSYLVQDLTPDRRGRIALYNGTEGTVRAPLKEVRSC